MSDRSVVSSFVRAVLLLAFALGALSVRAGDETSEPPVRDPTRPPAGATDGSTKRTPDGGLRLHSTAVAADKRSAVINDAVVGVGSRLGGAEVTAIEQGRVTLKRGSETIVLQLTTLPVKRPAGDSS